MNDLVWNVIRDIFILLLVYQEKHFFCDYIFQNAYMLQKFKDDWGFAKPLALHCGVHSSATFLIVTVYLVFHKCSSLDIFIYSLGLALFDFAVHFIMDRIKAGLKYLGCYKMLSTNEFNYLKRNLYEKFTLLPVKKKFIEEKIKSSTYFWWALCFDQKIHHYTHYAIIFVLIWVVWLKG